MIDGRSVLAIIPARGGSKGLPGKNLRPLAGRSLLEWTVTEARKSRYIDRLILSSDDAAIIAAAQGLGCEVPFVRPAALAADDTPGTLPVLHALEQLPGYDYVVLLQVTSPLRNASDIDACIARCAEAGSACVSVVEPHHHPAWTYRVTADGTLAAAWDGPEYSRRQDLPLLYAVNGAVYAARTEWFLKHRDFLAAGVVPHIMPEERSADIDTARDLALAECLLAFSGSHTDKL